MSDFVLPTTRYAVSGEVNIAYQTMGDGPIDIVLVPGIVSHVEFLHEFPEYTAFLRRLSTFARVVTFDKRGQGLSDRISGAPSLEERMDDVRAIMDDIGSHRAVLLGVSEGSAMSALFAATYPERVSQLILYGGFARSADLWGSDSSMEKVLRRIKHWGNGGLIKGANPSRAEDQEAVNQFAKFERLSASPGAYKAIVLLNMLIDVRSILPTVRVPTLVLHRRNELWFQSSGDGIWRRESPAPKLLNIPAVTTSTVPAMSKGCLATSRSLSPGIARVLRPISNAFWPRFCLRISSIRRAAPPRWATRHGVDCWIVTIDWRSRWSKSIVAL
jgi:pimeloyl-ACP methyl ester carboxylesterase